MVNTRRKSKDIKLRAMRWPEFIRVIFAVRSFMVIGKRIVEGKGGVHVH
jgi:hypothetical protein